MTTKEFMTIIRKSKQIGMGSCRIAFEMENGNVLKTFSGAALYEECEDRYPRFESYTLMMAHRSMNRNPSLDNYFYFLSQQMLEIDLWEKSKSDLLIPILEWGYVDNGLLYVIMPKATVVEAGYMIPSYGSEEEESSVLAAYNLYYDKEVAEELYEEWKNQICDFEEEYGVFVSDVDENDNNIGFYDGRLVIIDYGYCSYS